MQTDILHVPLILVHLYSYIYGKLQECQEQKEEAEMLTHFQQQKSPELSNKLLTRVPSIESINEKLMYTIRRESQITRMNWNELKTNSWCNNSYFKDAKQYSWSQKKQRKT